MNETNTNPRQKFILNVITISNGVLRSEIQQTAEKNYKISKPTLIRDLNQLINQKLIRIEGRGKNTKYFPYSKNPLLRPFDLELYFSIEPDNRTGTKKYFDFYLFNHLNDLFSSGEIEKLNENMKKFESRYFKKRTRKIWNRTFLEILEN